MDGIQDATKAIFKPIKIDQVVATDGSESQEKLAAANNLSKPALSEPTELGRRALGNQASFTELLGRLMTLLGQKLVTIFGKSCGFY